MKVTVSIPEGARLHRFGEVVVYKGTDSIGRHLFRSPSGTAALSDAEVDQELMDGLLSTRIPR